MGKAVECMSFHQALHRNLVYLAQLADSTQNMAQLLPVSREDRRIRRLFEDFDCRWIAKEDAQ